MDFELPPDTLMLRDMLRRFLLKEARPLEMKYFNTGKLEPEERARLRKSVEQLGLWGIMAPEQFGGGGLDTITACVIEEELGGTFIPVELGDVPTMLYACQGSQVDRYLEPALAGERRPIIAAREPGLYGLHPEHWMTSAIHCGEEYLISGRKILGTQLEPEDFLILVTKTENGAGPLGFSAFLVDGDQPGIDVFKGVEIQARFEDCRVGSDQILGEPGRALSTASQEAPRAWILLGARYVGIAERLIEMGIEHAKDWVSLGAPLAARPAIQRMLSEMRVDVESSRWMVYHAAWLLDSGKHDKIQCTAAQVRLATGVMLQRAVDTITMVFAGPGPAPQIEPQRMVRAAIPPEALELAIERTRAVVANDMLGLSHS